MTALTGISALAAFAVAAAAAPAAGATPVPTDPVTSKKPAPAATPAPAPPTTPPVETAPAPAVPPPAGPGPGPDGVPPTCPAAGAHDGELTTGQPAPGTPPASIPGDTAPCPPVETPEPDTRLGLRKIEPRTDERAGRLSPRRPADGRDGETRDGKAERNQGDRDGRPKRRREQRADRGQGTGGAEWQTATETLPAVPATLPDWPGALALDEALAVPNALIDGFRIPPFLLPIYQAAGIQYGVPWQVLASINEIETDYGRNLNVSSAGAMGWMQFLPSSWHAYGVDANGDGRKDPYNPADAIFAAARYLAAAGAGDDLRRAIFAYNHADWYVESVMLRAKLVTALPPSLVNAVTGLARGRFPVVGPARWSAAGRAVEIRAEPDAPVVAVHDGVVAGIGRSPERGRYVVLRDIQGNVYTYTQLGPLARVYPAPRLRAPRAAIREPLQPSTESDPAGPTRPGLAPAGPAPTGPASAGRQPSAEAERAIRGGNATPALDSAATKERLFANPRTSGAYRSGGREQLLRAGAPLERETSFEAELRRTLGAAREHTTLKPLEEGAQVAAGTVLAKAGTSPEADAAAPAPPAAPRSALRLAIRPRGRRTAPIAAGPILRGWRLLEQTAVYRGRRRGGALASDAGRPTVGQLLLMGEAQLARHVLADERIEVYGCGRGDIATGQIDGRVLAALAYLASTGLHPRVTSLRCGHSFLTASGNVSEHSSGNAVDIAAINGIPILGHQGPGSITDVTVRRLLELQGALEPHQVISLMGFEDGDSAIAMGDHADHIHVGFDPSPATGGGGALLPPRQWQRLGERLGEIANPVLAGSSATRRTAPVSEN